MIIAHHQPININPSKVRATLEFSSENSMGNSSVASVATFSVVIPECPPNSAADPPIFACEAALLRCVADF